jgi:hypothetical protein
LVLSLGRSGSVLPWKPSNFQQESPINYQKCPNYEKRNKNAGDFQTFILIDSPKQMNKYKDADESDKNMSDLKHKNVNDTNNCS